jgi:hypothetical protein
MTRTSAILACLVAGHAAAAGLFWWFINVPESNITMLSLSAALIVLTIVVLGWTEATAALLLWDSACGFRRAARRAFGALPAFIVGLLVFALFWWMTARADAWATAYSGQIDAWWMASTGSAKTAWIHSGLAIVLWFLRYVAGVSLAVAALAAGATGGRRALLSARWLRAALARRQLGAIGLAMLLGVWLPLRATDWRPDAIPPTAVEAVFIAAKLGLLYLVLNAGWALVLRAGATGAASRPPISAASSAPSPS